MKMQQALSENAVLITRRIPEGLYGKIKTLAKETDRNPSDMYQHLLKLGVQKLEEDRGQRSE